MLTNNKWVPAVPRPNLDSEEALEIARANNQIRFDIGYEPDELYSEMLY